MSYLFYVAYSFTLSTGQVVGHAAVPHTTPVLGFNDLTALAEKVGKPLHAKGLPFPAPRITITNYKVLRGPDDPNAALVEEVDRLRAMLGAVASYAEGNTDTSTPRAEVLTTIAETCRDAALGIDRA